MDTTSMTECDFLSGELAAAVQADITPMGENGLTPQPVTSFCTYYC